MASEEHTMTSRLLCLLLVFITGCASQHQTFRERPRDSQVIGGQMVQLNCRIDYLKGQVQWVRNGIALGFSRQVTGYPRYSIQGIEEDGEWDLLISGAAMEDDGIYQCQVGPGGGDQRLRAYARLTVLMAPGQPVIENYENGTEVQVPHEQPTLNLTCVSEGGKPGANLTWHRNGGPLSATASVNASIERLPSKLETSTSVLTIQPGREDNNALYSCSAMNDALARPLVTVVRLSVMHPPGAPVIRGYTPGQIIKTGDTLILVCVSRGGNPLAQVYWYRNDEERDFSYTSGNDRAENELVFTVQPTDNEAVFRCEATNMVTPRPLKAEVQLMVHFAPESVRITGHRHAKAGETVTLRCTSAISNPPADITWISRGQQQAGATQRVESSPQGGFITISEIRVRVTDRDDHVGYQCTATHDALGKVVSDIVELEVMYPPDPPTIAGYTAGRAVYANSAQTLTCNCMGGNPPATLTWTKGWERINGEVETVGNIVTNRIYFLLKDSDNGETYSCEAKNNATRVPLVTSVTLTVNFPSKSLNITMEPKRAKVGQPVNITCTSSSSNPRSELSWLRDGQEIESIDGGSRPGKYGGFTSMSHLQIIPSVADDGKIYACTATNPLLRQSVSDAKTLDVVYKPFFPPGLITKVNVVEGNWSVVNMSALGNPNNISYTWYKGDHRLQFSSSRSSRFGSRGPLMPGSYGGFFGGSTYGRSSYGGSSRSGTSSYGGSSRSGTSSYGSSSRSGTSSYGSSSRSGTSSYGSSSRSGTSSYGSSSRSGTSSYGGSSRSGTSSYGGSSRSGTSSYGGSSRSGTSGYSSGTSRSGTSGYSSGTSRSGTSGYSSGTSRSGTSGYSSGTSRSGTSGYSSGSSRSGTSGYSGGSANSRAPGTSYPGTSGYSSGTSRSGTSGSGYGSGSRSSSGASGSGYGSGSRSSSGASGSGYGSGSRSSSGASGSGYGSGSRSSSGTSGSGYRSGSHSSSGTSGSGYGSGSRSSSGTSGSGYGSGSRSSSGASGSGYGSGSRSSSGASGSGYGSGSRSSSGASGSGYGSGSRSSSGASGSGYGSGSRSSSGSGSGWGSSYSGRRRTKRDFSLPRFIQNGSVVNMTRVSRNDAGVYIVEASNEEGRTNHTLVLNVLYSPYIRRSSRQMVDQGSTARLECEIDANPLRPEMVNWTRNNYNMSRTSMSFVDGTTYLEITDVNKADSGLFVCRVNNSIGEPGQGNAELLVRYAPEIDPSPVYGKAAAERGGTARLICRAEGVPDINFKWFRGPDQINTSYAKYDISYNKRGLISYESQLIVYNTSLSDYDQYKCRAENTLGSDQRIVRLDGTSRPDAPFELRVTNVTGSSVTLVWRPGFDGGILQSFQVRYRELPDSKKATSYKYENVLPERANTYSISDLRPNTKYSFSVRGRNTLGNGPFSDQAIVQRTGMFVPGASSFGGGSSSNDVPLIIILTVCIVGILLLGLNVLLILFFIRRRRKKLNNTDSDLSSQANSLEMYNAPSLTDDTKSYTTYDKKSIEGFPEDRYYDYGSTKGVYSTESFRGSRANLPPPVYGSGYIPQEFDYPSFPKGATSREAVYPSDQYSRDPYSRDPRTISLGAPPGETNDDEEYADQLRKMQLSITSDDYPALPSPGAKASPRDYQPPVPDRPKSATNEPPIPARHYDRDDLRYTPAPGSRTYSTSGDIVRGAMV